MYSSSRREEALFALSRGESGEEFEPHSRTKMQSLSHDEVLA